MIGHLALVHSATLGVLIKALCERRQLRLPLHAFLLRLSIEGVERTAPMAVVNQNRIRCRAVGCGALCISSCPCA
jgi:hypothetical protein